MIHFLLWHNTTHAAALEQSTLGDLFASPVISSPYSAWWNPAMLPTESTSLLIGGGFQHGQLVLETNQNSNRYTGSGPKIEGGAVTQISRLRLGVSSGIPYGLIGKSHQEPDYLLQKARVVIAAHNLAVASQLGTWDFGIGVTVYQANWKSEVRTDGLYDYAQTLQATGLQPEYTDDQIMRSDYAIDVELDGRDVGLGTTIGFTKQIKDWTIGASTNLSPILNIDGKASLTFQCPPDSDPIAQENADDLGLCNTTLRGDAKHELPLPHRLQFGARYQWPEHHTFSISSGTVRWERYQDFALELSNFTTNIEAQQFIERPHPWARDLKPSYWLNLTYDHQHAFLRTYYRFNLDTPSVPQALLTPNNSDALTISTRSGISHTHTMHNLNKWTIGLSGCLSYRAPRQNETSAFSLSIENPMLESRYRWPNSAGKYTGFVTGINAFLSYNLSP